MFVDAVLLELRLGEYWQRRGGSSGERERDWLGTPEVKTSRDLGREVDWL
jgi:hypothetical protein